MPFQNVHAPHGLIKVSVLPTLNPHPCMVFIVRFAKNHQHDDQIE